VSVVAVRRAAQQVSDLSAMLTGSSNTAPPLLYSASELRAGLLAYLERA